MAPRVALCSTSITTLSFSVRVAKLRRKLLIATRGAPQGKRSIMKKKQQFLGYQALPTRSVSPPVNQQNWLSRRGSGTLQQPGEQQQPQVQQQQQQQNSQQRRPQRAGISKPIAPGQVRRCGGECCSKGGVKAPPARECHMPAWSDTRALAPVCRSGRLPGVESASSRCQMSCKARPPLPATVAWRSLPSSRCGHFLISLFV
jgi:hypothetical protein